MTEREGGEEGERGRNMRARLVQNEKKPPGLRPEGGRRAPREEYCASVANAPAWPAREPPPSLSAPLVRARVEVRELFACTRALVSLFAATATEPALAGSPLARCASARGRRKVDARVGEVELWRLEDEDASRGRVSRRTKRCSCLSPFDGSRLSQPDSTFPNRACSTNGGHLAAAPRCIGV